MIDDDLLEALECLHLRTSWHLRRRKPVPTRTLRAATAIALSLGDRLPDGYRKDLDLTIADSRRIADRRTR